MKIIEQYHKIIHPTELDEMVWLIQIDDAARTCYKAEPHGQREEFVQRLISSGHLSTIEHCNMTVRFVTDRGVTHELVRHRLAAYSQESTRYCNYSKDKFGGEITVIKPVYWDEGRDEWFHWEAGCKAAELSYMKLLKMGATPQEARAVLPNSLKTEIVMTANLREWRHVLSLRTSPAAHPQIRELMLGLLDELKTSCSHLFGDIR